MHRAVTEVALPVSSIATDNGVALSLGSSFRGYYAHCGFLAEFSKSGIVPSRMAGSSAGAIAGLLYAHGLRENELVDFILEKGLTRSFFDWGELHRIPGIVSFLRGTGLFTGNGAVTLLKERLGNLRLESFRDPKLEIAVTDRSSAEALILSEGDAIELAIASCAVPGLFRARRIGGSLYWDGGLANDIPFHHWLDEPSVHTIVLHTIRHTEHTLPVPKWWNLGRGVAVGHQVVTEELNRHRKELAELKGKRVVECVTEADHPRLSNRRRGALVDAGRRTGWQAVETLRDVLSQVSRTAKEGCDEETL